MEMESRPYQERSIGMLQDGFHDGERWQILSLPTGAGKTETVIRMAQLAVEKGHVVLFLCDMEHLILQTAERFEGYGLPVGILQGKNTRDLDRNIIVASPQTLRHRALPRRPQLTIVDECHVVYRDCLEQLVSFRCYVIGLTATPFSSSLFSADAATMYGPIHVGTTTNALIQDGYLVPLEAVIAEGDVAIDRDTLETDSAGEYTDNSISKAAIKIVGGICETWEKARQEYWPDRTDIPPTLICGPTMDWCYVMEQELADQGYNFQVVGYKEKAEDNAASIRAFKAGQLDGVLTCDSLIKGFDYPGLEILIDVRPLQKSFSRHVQKLGRVLRVFAGKKLGLVIDHAGNYARFEKELTRFYATGQFNPPLLDAGNTESKEASDKEAEAQIIEMSEAIGFTIHSPHPTQYQIDLFNRDDFRDGYTLDLRGIRKNADVVLKRMREMKKSW